MELKLNASKVKRHMYQGNKEKFCSFIHSKAQKLQKKKTQFFFIKLKNETPRFFTKAPFLLSHISFSYNQILFRMSLSEVAEVHLDFIFLTEQKAALFEYRNFTDELLCPCLPNTLSHF